MSTIKQARPPRVDEALEGVRQFASLPDWLTAAVDPERVGAAIRRDIPEFASGQLILEGCQVKRARLKRNYWTALYDLDVIEPHSQMRRSVALLGKLIPPGSDEPAGADGAATFGGPEWRCYLREVRLGLEPQPPDAALPALPHLTDPEEARALLERSISAMSPAYRHIQIRACTPRVVRYKPGSRCTILYDLEYAADAPADGWPELVVAKTYVGDKGQNAWEGMRALWDSSLARSGTVTIAEPLAFVPEMNVLVQGPIREEQTLKDLMGSALRAGTPEALAELDHFMRMTALGLVELHRANVGVGDARVWEDELAEVREVIDRLASSVPGLAGAASPLISRLQAVAVEHRPDPPVPTHGTFRPAQVLINKGQIGFIDFDGFCQAEPALDLGLFLGKIKDIGLSVLSEDSGEHEALSRETLDERMDRMDAICENFLAEYESHLPVSRQRIMLWESVDLLTLVLHCWTKVKSARLDANMLLLERHLRKSGLV